MATGSSNEQLWQEMQERLQRVRRQRESLAAAPKPKYYREWKRTPSPLYLPRIDGNDERVRNSSPDLRRGHFGVIPPVYSPIINQQDARRNFSLAGDKQYANASDSYGRNRKAQLYNEFGTGQYNSRSYSPVNTRNSRLEENPKLSYISTKPVEFVSDDPRIRNMEERRSQVSLVSDLRGHHQRSQSYPSRFPQEFDPLILDAAQHIISSQSFAIDFVERFILECLEDEIIPDLLINLLSISNNALVQYSPVTAIQVYQTDEDIVQAIATDILQETLVEKTGLLMSMAIDQLVAHQLSAIHSQDFITHILEDFEQEALPSLVEEAMLEVEIEESIDMVLSEVIKKMSEEVAIEVIQHYDNSLLEQEMKEVYEHAKGKLLASAMLDQLLFTSLRNSQLWTEQEKADKLIDGMMLDNFLFQYLEVWNCHKKTEECQPMRQLHENTFTNMAIDEIIDELKLHLDEDMADLDEYETGLDLDPP